MPRYDHWDRDDFRRLTKLEDSDLFKNFLLPDIQRGIVFPAIRGGKIDFYHVGRKLFSFTSTGFRSNIAYVVACENRPQKKEVTERDLAGLKLCTSFQEGYEQIRNNTKRYKEPESEQVAHIWNAHSYCRNASGPIVVLDIELSLNANDDGREGADRIDLILFNTTTRCLHLFEVKTFQNQEIKAKAKVGPPPVVEQIARYNRQLQNKNVVEMYDQYVRIVNRLFGKDLPTPVAVSPKVHLLVFNFDGGQEENAVKLIAKQLLELEIVCRSKGCAKGATQGTLGVWCKKKK